MASTAPDRSPSNASFLLGFLAAVVVVLAVALAGLVAWMLLGSSADRSLGEMTSAPSRPPPRMPPPTPFGGSSDPSDDVKSPDVGDVAQSGREEPSPFGSGFAASGPGEPDPQGVDAGHTQPGRGSGFGGGFAPPTQTNTPLDTPTPKPDEAPKVPDPEPRRPDPPDAPSEPAPPSKPKEPPQKKPETPPSSPSGKIEFQIPTFAAERLKELADKLKSFPRNPSERKARTEQIEATVDESIHAIAAAIRLVSRQAAECHSASDLALRRGLGSTGDPQWRSLERRLRSDFVGTCNEIIDPAKVLAGAQCIGSVRAAEFGDAIEASGLNSALVDLHRHVSRFDSSPLKSPPTLNSRSGSDSFRLLGVWLSGVQTFAQQHIKPAD